jgi:hypothetical protein
LVAGLVVWPTPFVLEAGIGLPDVSDCSDWLKIGALARSATAFYGLELVNDVTKWMEIGGTVTYENTWMQINMARKPEGMPFLGRGDLTAITIRDATGNQVYFDPGSVRVETEGGTKSRWPKGTNILDPTFPVTDDFPVMTEFDVILSSEGYGMALVPRHKFTFPYKAPCIAWYFPSTNTINLPAVESPDPEVP